VHLRGVSFPNVSLPINVRFVNVTDQTASLSNATATYVNSTELVLTTSAFSASGAVTDVSVSFNEQDYLTTGVQFFAFGARARVGFGLASCFVRSAFTPRTCALFGLRAPHSLHHRAQPTRR